MAVDLAKKHASFIGRSVQAAQDFIRSYNQMVGLRAEWDSLAYSTGIVDSDFTVVSGGLSYPYLTAADLQLFYNSQGNLVTYFASGNGTNIEKLIP